MKKITLLLTAFTLSFYMSGQTVLSHSVDNDFYASGSVACGTDPDETPGSGDEGSSDNIFYRAYTPADMGVVNSFEVTGARFFISFVDISGTNQTHDFTLRFYTSTGTFPSGTFTEIGSQSLQASVADHATLMEVTLDTPFVVDGDEEIIIALDMPAAAPVPNNYSIRIGINGLGETQPSYLSSIGCGIPTPVTPASIGFQNQHFILDIVGNDILSISDYLASQTSVSPNPAIDVINVKVPSNIDITGAVLYDVLGKNTGISISNGTMNVANLSKGVYILSLETSAGTLTKKVVKK